MKWVFFRWHSPPSPPPLPLPTLLLPAVSSICSFLVALIPCAFVVFVPFLFVRPCIICFHSSGGVRICFYDRVQFVVVRHTVNYSDQNALWAHFECCFVSHQNYSIVSVSILRFHAIPFGRCSLSVCSILPVEQSTENATIHLIDMHFSGCTDRK